jgi:hypothetical protein
MAVETFASRSINAVIVENFGADPKVYLANGTDLKPGYVVTCIGETADTKDIDQCAAGEFPLGVVTEYVVNSYAGAPRSLDAANQDNEEVKVKEFHDGGRCVAYMRMLATSATSKRGTPLIVSSTAGMVTPYTKNAAAAIDTAGGNTYADTTTEAGIDAAVGDDSMLVVGWLAEDYTQDNSDDILVKVKLA